RVRSRLSQSMLAHVAGTSQSTIASYECGRKSPSFATLTRILAAAGFELRTRLEIADAHDRVLDELMRAAPVAEQRKFAREQAARLKRS
ncbi:MAG: helix-turn-helix domain-containing protein, partial [Pseudonocardiaceae bacterium]